MFKLKLKGFLGIIPHALIIGGCAVAMSWPFLNIAAVWFFILFITATHLIQDAVKLKFSSPKSSFWTYLLDQFSHAGLISLMFFTDLRKLQPPANQSDFLVWFYSNNEMMVYLIALIAATYNGHFLIRCFKDTFIKNANPCDLYEKWFGMFERTLIVTFFFIRLPLWVIVPASMAIRPMTYVLLRKKLSLHRCFVDLPDMVLSWIIALSCGFILYLLQTRYPVY